MAYDQFEVQNLSAAAKKPATFVTSLWPGMIVACFRRKVRVMCSEDNGISWNIVYEWVAESEGQVDGEEDVGVGTNSDKRLR